MNKDAKILTKYYQTKLNATFKKGHSKYSSVAGLGLHDKVRTYTRGMGLDRKPKT
jgi:hypothetical protein